MRFVADPGAAVDHTMRVHRDAVSQKNFIADHNVGADATAGANECPRTDYSRGMDLICSILN